MADKGKTTENLAPQKVKMKFSEHKYLNDMNTPHFYAGEVYEVEGAETIQRWLKRGGVIVSGELKTPKPEGTPSTVVQQKPTEPVVVAPETKPEEDQGIDQVDLDEEDEDLDDDVEVEETKPVHNKGKGKGKGKK